jgi:hypothetical protein
MPIIGSTLGFSAQLYDKDPALGGVLVNALTAALVITLPDGVSVAPGVTVTNPPAVTGKYTYDYTTLVQTGQVRGTWTFTMSGGKTVVYTEYFDVEPLDPQWIISLRNAKKQLNIPVTDVTDDEEIGDYIGGITRVIEDHIGACIPRTVVEYKEGNVDVIRLDVTPVLSITTMTPYLTAGTSYLAAAMRVTPEGRLRLLTGLPFSWGPFEITYVAGRRPVPANARIAARMILQHIWETQRGSAGVPLSGDEETTLVPGFGFAVPTRALELLHPDDEGPAIG